MFIGRQRELTKLNELHESGKFECAVIYGRRRVGKTTLINEFTKDKDSIFFMGLESNAKDNLEALSRSIFAFNSEYAASGAIFPSFQNALDVIFDLAREKRLVLVLDEFPYLATAYKGISSILQQYIDKFQHDSKLFIILCGSSLSFMEYQVLGYKSPLYGRRTAQFKIKPFEFAEARGFYSAFTPEELVAVYGVTGGIPLYMSMFDDRFSLEQNIRTNFFSPDAYLFEEANNLVKQECREPAQYNAIIKAIAAGASRLSEIASKIGVDTGLCSNYLTTLQSLGIIKKEFPFREETSRKTIYAIDDGMFRFWYRFVPDNMALIQQGQSDLVYRRVAPQLPAFLGAVFEDICKQWLWRENIAERLPLQFVDLGRWWGNDPVRKCETEIDIIAYADEDHALFGECKWTNEKVDTGVLDELIRRSELFRYHQKFLYIFAKSGFTSGCKEKADMLGNVRLVSFTEMF